MEKQVCRQRLGLPYEAVSPTPAVGNVSRLPTGGSRIWFPAVSDALLGRIAGSQFPHSLATAEGGLNKLGTCRPALASSTEARHPPPIEL